MKEKYPPNVKRLLAGHRTGAAVMLVMAAASWFYTHSFISVLFGAFLAFVLLILGVRFRNKVRKEGYEWKKYHVIEHTYLSRWHRKPTGFLALSFNEGEPIRRYHFALADNTRTPEIGADVEVCIPGGVRISEIGRNFYVSSHYGIMQNGEPL